VLESPAGGRSTRQKRKKPTREIARRLTLASAYAATDHPACGRTAPRLVIRLFFRSLSVVECVRERHSQTHSQTNSRIILGGLGNASRILWRAFAGLSAPTFLTNTLFTQHPTLEGISHRRRGPLESVFRFSVLRGGCGSRQGWCRRQGCHWTSAEKARGRWETPS
jgi:hypothetical protein